MVVCVRMSSWNANTKSIAAEAKAVAATHKTWAKRGYADALSSSEIATLETYEARRAAMTDVQRRTDDMLATQRPAAAADVSWSHIRQTAERKADGTLGDYYIQPRNIAVRHIFFLENGNKRHYRFQDNYLKEFLPDPQWKVFEALLKSIAPAGNLQVTTVELCKMTGLTEEMVLKSVARLALIGVIGMWHTAAGNAYTILATGCTKLDQDPNLILGSEALKANGMLERGVLKYDPFAGKNVWLESGKYAAFKRNPGGSMVAAKRAHKDGVRAASIWATPTVETEAEERGGKRYVHAYATAPQERPRSGRATTATVDMTRAPGLTNEVTRILMKANGSYQEIRGISTTANTQKKPADLARFMLPSISLLEVLKSMGTQGTRVPGRYSDTTSEKAKEILLGTDTRVTTGMPYGGLREAIKRRIRRDPGYREAVEAALGGLEEGIASKIRVEVRL